MANRNAYDKQYSYEPMRKSANCHCYFGASGAVTLDAPGSKGVLSMTQIATPAQAGLYTIRFGYFVGALVYVDTYIKSLVLDNAPELEYSGNTNPAATASPAIFRDDANNAIPQPFGDVAPVQSAPVLAGGGAFAAGTYRWLVSAVDSAGNETQLATMLPQEQTAAPTLNQQATIAWATVAGAVSYNVYRTAAAGGSGTENVFVGNTTGLSLIDAGTAGTALYQGGALANVGGAKLPNFKLPAYNFARPAFGYGALTLGFYVGTTPTNPAQGEGMRIQVEFGDSGTA